MVTYQNENKPSGITLNEILTILPEEYNQWTICLNNGENGLSETLYNQDIENAKSLMRHLSYKKDMKKSSSFRVIHTKYCLQFIGLHRENRYDNWLFIGAFENNGVKSENGHEYYNLTKIDRFSHFEERLIIEYKKHQGDKQAKLNIRNIETINVFELLPVRYVNRTRIFPGFKNFTIDFSELADIINCNVTNWRSILSPVQCIYAITDSKGKKVYVGSTYGSKGIWQRWSCYVETNGHGGDVELKKLIDDNPRYAYDYFTFSILEYFYDNDPEQILKRESKWKDILQTRILGYNKN